MLQVFDLLFKILYPKCLRSLLNVFLKLINPNSDISCVKHPSCGWNIISLNHWSSFMVRFKQKMNLEAIPTWFSLSIFIINLETLFKQTLAIWTTWNIKLSFHIYFMYCPTTIIELPFDTFLPTMQCYTYSASKFWNSCSQIHSDVYQEPSGKVSQP